MREAKTPPGQLTRERVCVGMRGFAAGSLVADVRDVDPGQQARVGFEERGDLASLPLERLLQQGDGAVRVPGQAPAVCIVRGTGRERADGKSRGNRPREG